MEGEREGEGEEKEYDEDEDEEDEGEGERDGEGEGEGEEREEGEKRKGWMRGMKEEKEEWETEKEAGIGEWALWRRLFGVEKRGKEKMAGWRVVREKFVRAREAWAERKRGHWWWWWWWLLSEGGWMVQVEEEMDAAEWCWAVRSGQPLRGMRLRWVTHKEVLMRARLV
ncbi:uncharacterized protein MONOS_10068 [Monocercomonoides exilis]|uniref:uncharacterized protein n=1 Tax=Monocercomonoides exilis TaxID=2049356 RepID=UPI00355A6374|nr:hypothetical protein MONOS_10068 [Monocercomonoides exilis]|eukprot:MONOS_10068.1-p1 / transcript=MONOS_10068.1 / gene=MONOS_10068 / organism=Monocercomonoides_exilis_PA203 / gene_product=unspecified product / transcript_product=unspecified product / location=Mono_scaffold00441:32144-32650(-) / protein_length=169 / sequence_SO=supercontig / SO=protein_coding / is_pseudo=false